MLDLEEKENKHFLKMTIFYISILFSIIIIIIMFLFGKTSIQQLNIDKMSSGQYILQELKLKREKEKKEETGEDIMNFKSNKIDKFIVEDDYQNMKLIIPKIKVKENIIDANGQSLRFFYRTIRNNIRLEGAMPKQEGKTLLGAHSSAPRINPFGLRPILKDLHTLEKGDKLYIETDKYIYTYSVTSKFKGKKGENINGMLNNTKTNTLLIHTCPGVSETGFGRQLYFIDSILTDINKKENYYIGEDFKLLKIIKDDK